MKDDKSQTYDFICFTDLAYEFDLTKKKEIEKKIKGRLKYHKLGDYKQERVDYIRQLKDDLCSEISDPRKSKYYHNSKSMYAVLEDFNVVQMTADYNKKYNKVNKTELIGMINFAIYLYYLR